MARCIIKTRGLHAGNPMPSGKSGPCPTLRSQHRFFLFPGTSYEHRVCSVSSVSLRPQVSTDKITYLAVYDVANSEKREKYDQDLKDYVAKEAPPGYESSLGEAASINVQKSAKHSRREAFGWTNQSMVSVIGSGVKFDASAGCGGLGFGFANKQPCFLIRPGRTSMVPGVLWVACYPYAGESLIEKIVYVGPSVGGKNVNGFPVKGFFPVKPRTGTEQRAAEAAGKGPHAPMPYMYLKVYLKQQREGTFKSDTEERQVEIQCYQLAKNVPLDLTRRSGMNIFTILAAELRKRALDKTPSWARDSLKAIGNHEQEITAFALETPETREPETRARGILNAFI
ncbi:unnamed protein product, partial [Notodromas monacha]